MLYVPLASRREKKRIGDDSSKPASLCRSPGAKSLVATVPAYRLLASQQHAQLTGALTTSKTICICNCFFFRHVDASRLVRTYSLAPLHLPAQLACVCPWLAAILRESTVADSHRVFPPCTPYQLYLCLARQRPRVPPTLSTIMGDMANEIKLLSGSSHPSLAKSVADRYVAFISISTSASVSVKHLRWVALSL